VPAILLKKSWLADELTAKEIEDAEAVLTYANSGENLPEELIDRVGVKIINPKDPRLEYRKQEKNLLSCLQSKIDLYEKFYMTLPEYSSVLDKEVNVQFAPAASSGEARESKFIILRKPDDKISIEKLLSDADKKGMIVKLDDGDCFCPIDPGAGLISEIQWNVPDDCSELSGNMVLYGIDRQTNAVIGTGSLEEDEAGKYAAVKIHYKSLKRTISSLNDIMLVAVEI
jgi:hypothetical protein